MAAERQTGSDREVAEGPLPAPREDDGPRVMKWVKDVGAIVGVVATGVGLLFVFLPDLKPEPRPASSGAGLKLVSFDPDTSRREYLARTDQGRAGFTPEQLDRRGAFVLFGVELEGFKGKPLTLKREVIDSRSGNQISEERAITITPPQNQVKRDWHYWVPLPAADGPFTIVLQLLAKGEDAALATLETPPFRGL